MKKRKCKCPKLTPSKAGRKLRQVQLDRLKHEKTNASMMKKIDRKRRRKIPYNIQSQSQPQSARSPSPPPYAGGAP